METILIGRILFAICLALSWMNSVTHIIQSDEMVYTRGMQARVWHKSAWKYLFPTSIIFLLLCVAFTIEYFEVLSGVLIIAMIYWIRRWEISLWHNNIVVRLGKYSPSGSCLFVYLIGCIIGPYFDQDPQALGLEISCGALGAAWFLAGWKKIEYSGLQWMSRQTVGLLIAERVYIGHPLARGIRKQILKHPILLTIIGVLGLVLELIGPVFCFPELRMAYAIIINLLLAGTTFIFGYVEPEWMLIILALAMMG